MQINVLRHYAHARARALTTIGLLLCAASACSLFISAAPSRAGGLRSSYARHHEEYAKRANVEAFEMHLTLEITSIKGNVIDAEGKVSGKLTGKASLRLDLVNASRGFASFTGYNSRGTVAGTGWANYRVSGAVSYFQGSNPALHGYGKYTGLKSLGIKMTGTLNRRTLDITINVQGKVSE
jgi:hypothetical protein